MDPIEREFLNYWIREREYDQVGQMGRLLGVMFQAGEVRSWREGGGGEGYDDEDNILVPLTFALRPEAREAIRKMVGSDGMKLPEGYQKQSGEFVVDLGKVSPQDFIDFVNQNRVTGPKG